MAKVNVMDIMKTRIVTPAEFQFDNFFIPPMQYFLSNNDVAALHDIATSVKLSSNIKLKYKLIDDIMRPRGFKRFSAGTNRIVYRYYEDESFVVKIAVDRVGLKDNPAEFYNQNFLKPYVAKMFYVSPCGTVGFAERVLPIKNKEEFKEISSDVFDMLVFNIIGQYVVEDIGTKYFMNYGVRKGYGPVLLDYPYVYKLDGKKLFCTNILPETNTVCDGEIDYDDGFNNLVCTKCGKKYLAVELRDKSNNNKSINIKGGSNMKVSIKYGDKVIWRSISTDDTIVRRKETVDSPKTSEGLKVSISYNGENISRDIYNNINNDNSTVKEENKPSNSEEKVVEEKSVDDAKIIADNIKTEELSDIREEDEEKINDYSDIVNDSETTSELVKEDNTEKDESLNDNSDHADDYYDTYDYESNTDSDDEEESSINSYINNDNNANEEKSNKYSEYSRYSSSKYSNRSYYDDYDDDDYRSRSKSKNFERKNNKFKSSKPNIRVKSNLIDRIDE